MVSPACGYDSYGADTCADEPAKGATLDGSTVLLVTNYLICDTRTLRWGSLVMRLLLFFR